MNQDALKQQVAKAALHYVPDDSIIGVGTGSTVNCFIAELAKVTLRIKGAVASSEASAQRLRAAGIEVQDLNDSGPLSVYIDGADEVTRHLHMIKGGGAALTREKVVAGASDKFVCIADQSKMVDLLGKFPLPIEVIPMARSFVAREMVKLGGHPEWRIRDGKAVVTDNGNWILDIRGLDILNPVELESTIDHIPGVVSNGLFARRGADVLLLAGEGGIETVLK